MNALKFLVQKGEALEQWQEQLLHAQQMKAAGAEVHSYVDNVTLEQSRQARLENMEKVIESNMNISTELRGIFKDGREVRGIVPEGWGSVAHVRVDRTTGEIEFAERMTTPEDGMFAVHYINYLEKNFKEMKEKEQLENQKAAKEDNGSETKNDQVDSSSPPEFELKSSELSDDKVNDSSKMIEDHFANEFDNKDQKKEEADGFKNMLRPESPQDKTHDK